MRTLGWMICPLMLCAGTGWAQDGSKQANPFPPLPASGQGSKQAPDERKPVDRVSQLTQSKEYQAGYKQGRAEADRELERQEATIYTAGLPEKPGEENLDQETGLLYSNFGCVVDNELLGRIAGHNDRIKESIQLHGLPKNSFKPWEKELFGLEDHVAARRKSEKPERLTLDGPVRKSPDGKATIKIIQRSFKRRDGTVGKSLWLEQGGDERTPEDFPLPAHDDDTVECYWGPKGSGFVVIAVTCSGHGKESGYGHYTAWDLKRRRVLRSEFVEHPEHPTAVDRDRTASNPPGA